MNSHIYTAMIAFTVTIYIYLFSSVFLFTLIFCILYSPSRSVAQKFKYTVKEWTVLLES